MISTTDIQINRVPTLSEPNLRISPELFNTAGGMYDSSITVIENPITTGYIGILFSKSFDQRIHGKPKLISTTHYRFDYNNGELSQTAKGYKSAEIFRDYSRQYNFILADGDQIPNPNSKPYFILFLDANELEQIEDHLLEEIKRDLEERHEIQNTSKDDPSDIFGEFKTMGKFLDRIAKKEKKINTYPTLAKVYSILAEKIHGYSLDDKGRLKLPIDYASLPVKPVF